MKNIKVQLVLSEEVNRLLTEIAKKEYRTRSAIVELALLAYWSKAKEKEREKK